MENFMGHFGKFWPRTGPRDHSHWNRLVLELVFPGVSSQTAQWGAVTWTFSNLPSHFGNKMDGFEDLAAQHGHEMDDFVDLAGQLWARDGWFRNFVKAILSRRWMEGSGAAFPLKSSISII